MERRFLSADVAPITLAARAEGGKTVTGYGAVFYKQGDAGTQYRLWGDVYERIMPGAFDRAIKEDDVRSLFNHDSNIVLGRLKAKTLRLSVDATGLRYEADAPDTQLIRDQVLSPINRGDVSGSSFMFVPRKVVWVEEERDGKQFEYREILEVELWEVGPVVFPAYASTTTGLRSLDDPAEARKSYDAWHAQRCATQQALDREAVAVRSRLLELDGL